MWKGVAALEQLVYISSPTGEQGVGGNKHIDSVGHSGRTAGLF